MTIIQSTSIYSNLIELIRNESIFSVTFYAIPGINTTLLPTYGYMNLTATDSSVAITPRMTILAQEVTSPWIGDNFYTNPSGGYIAKLHFIYNATTDHAHYLTNDERLVFDSLSDIDKLTYNEPESIHSELIAIWESSHPKKGN